MRDELVAIGVATDAPKLVRTALNGVTAPWAVFVQGLVARENLPSWDRVCDDFVQEEDVALTAKGKQKSKKGPKKGRAKQQQQG